ncbi:hypothetical protein PsalN5692_00330 [Piscirickettsia salmonis]|uniref:hypothetical protein n=2 Tax=Piscirickettsia salmonis TaxID=1238 RepID=UPI0012B8053A|nr:hypothetical protein [Piscirickettsia salmonis]QGP48915.1 hypothetical protein PsalN5692_00330 [Piscirickettsia salmonis]
MILQRYIDHGYLTTTKAEQLELDPFQSDVLNSETISQLIFANFISVDEVLQLSLREQSNLKLHSTSHVTQQELIDTIMFCSTT